MNEKKQRVELKNLPFPDMDVYQSRKFLVRTSKLIKSLFLSFKLEYELFIEFFRSLTRPSNFQRFLV